MKTSNRVICRNEVVIEGESFGQFEAFAMQADQRTFGATATLKLPLYAIGSGGTTQGRASSRVRSRLKADLIKVCAHVSVYCWYEGYDRTLVFDGFIEHIGQGFPATIYLRDASFVLRFGIVQKAWDGGVTIQQVIRDCVAIADEGFKTEREKAGLTRSVPTLKYSTDGEISNNVQATTTPISFDNYAAGRSPFEVLQNLMTLFCFYAGVDTNHNVYVGTGVKDSTRPVVTLDTRYNVVGRDITTADGRFVDYEVKITGILKNGRRYTATAGLATSRDASSKSALSKTSGETYRSFAPLDTIEELQKFADRQLEHLRGQRNKGTITTLLYPKCQLLDHVNYNDTVFDIYDAKYYVIGYSFVADANGYFQKLSVTDQVFLL